MELIVNDTDNIQTLKETFNKFFPYLKIELYKKNGQTGSSSAKNPVLNTKTLAEYRIMPVGSFITITSTMTVIELEKSFNKYYGLTTQVLRKSGNIWLGTTVTDNWTLEEQNKQGELLSSQINNAKTTNS
jgi:hypothetical protein